MKVLLRILYALVVALLFVFVQNYAHSVAADKYFQEEGLKAFVDSNPDKYRFFYGSTGYHKKEATYTIKQNDFTIQFFEINKVFKNKEGDVKVEEYYYIMIDHPTFVIPHQFPQVHYLRFSNDDATESFRVVQFKRLPFSVVVNNEEEGLIDALDLINKGFTKIELIEYYSEENEIILAESNVEMLEEHLTIKNVVEDNYNNIDVLNENGIFTKLPIESSEYAYIYYLIMIGYIIIMIIVTYFIFFFRPKKLGKEKPSKHFYKKTEK